MIFIFVIRQERIGLQSETVELLAIVGVASDSVT